MFGRRNLILPRKDVSEKKLNFKIMSIQKGTCTNKDNDYYKRKLSIIRDTDKNRNTKQGCQK